MSDPVPGSEPLKIRDREPEQGEQFTEPKIGGLYPMAGIFVGGMAVGIVAAYFAFT